MRVNTFFLSRKSTVQAPRLRTWGKPQQLCRTVPGIVIEISSSVQEKLAIKHSCWNCCISPSFHNFRTFIELTVITRVLMAYAYGNFIRENVVFWKIKCVLFPDRLLFPIYWRFFSDRRTIVLPCSGGGAVESLKPRSRSAVQDLRARKNHCRV